MERKIKNLINTYSDFVSNKEAAIFIGAGVSIQSGYVNWKELLIDAAESLGLNIEKEKDLIELAQFHKNKNSSRELLNRKLIAEFTKDAKPQNIHNLLSAMEIDEYWTTNYDTLLENTFRSNGKKVQIKANKEDLSRKNQNIEKTIYKMHGDISSPSKAVLIKEDYENYSEEWEDFSMVFKTALVQKTFLFIGISFEDPNLKYLLSRIKMLMQTKSRQHYCIMRKTNRKDYVDEEVFNYEYNKQQLRIEDLKRYNINVILIDEYEEIDLIIDRINKRVKYNRIFISGSATNYGIYNKNEVENFAFNLSYKLISNENQIVSGFGLGIGNFVINGALQYIFEKNKQIESSLKIRPFPQNIQDQKLREQFWRKYRVEMLKDVGISIFMFGNKNNKDNIIEAKGMFEEYEICQLYGIKIIPLPFTGFVAKHIFNDIESNFERYYPELSSNSSFVAKFKSLKKITKLNEETIEKIWDIIKSIKRSSSI